MTSNSASIHLYDILTEQGIEKDRAQRAVDAFVTRAEAERQLVTKNDAAEIRLQLSKMENRLIIWVVGVQIAATGLIIASGVIG